MAFEQWRDVACKATEHAFSGRPRHGVRIYLLSHQRAKRRLTDTKNATEIHGKSVHVYICTAIERCKLTERERVASLTQSPRWPARSAR
jgi:hypothetical protein